jgi:hypothetical protein
MVATPMYGGACSGMFTRSIADLSVLCASWGIRLQLYFLFNESLITRARNYCADEFMRSECTHLMFIDSDIGFNPQDVLALLALQDENADDEYDVMCGPYPKKCISWEKVKLAVDRGFGDENPNLLERFVGDFVFNPKDGATIRIDEPARVLESGTGFMMIRRSAFNKVAAKNPQLSYRPDHARTANFDGTREIMAYFMDPIDRTDYEGIYRAALEKIANATDDDERIAAREYAAEALATQETKSKRLLSEDYFFCQRVWDAGGAVWLCPWIELKHVGSYVFGGTLRDLAAVGANATVDLNEIAKIRAAEQRAKASAA